MVCLGAFGQDPGSLAGSGVQGGGEEGASGNLFHSKPCAVWLLCW